MPSPVFGFGMLAYWRRPEGQPGVCSLIWVPWSSESFLLTSKVDNSWETPAMEFFEHNSWTELEINTLVTTVTEIPNGVAREDLLFILIGLDL